LSVLFRGIVADPDLGDSLHLEAEVRQINQAFTQSPNVTNGPEVANGQVAWISSGPLADKQSYHWQVRVRDVTGRSGPWDSLPGGTDFAVNIPHAPNTPANLGQSKPDGTVINVGGISDTDFVVLSATVADQDPGDQLRLQVEVQPVGTNFIDSPTDSSPAVASGVAQVTVGKLGNNQDYHWQARTKDQSGLASPWVKFGGNAENQRDFRVQLASTPNAPTALGQFQSNGTDSIPVGGDASFTTVVFKGTVSDPDVGQTVRLDVEYKPVGTNFTDTPTVSSAPVANGSQASVGSLTLTTGVSYHWQARAVDNTNKQGGWVSFPLNPTNPESAVDFRVATPVSQLIFTQQPSSAVAGVAIGPAIKVTAADASGIPVTSFTGAITLAISPNPGGATLFGTTSVNAVAGVATFSDINIQKAANNYTLLASTSGFNRTSTAFNITPAATSQVAFTVQPTSATAGVAIAPPVQVSGQDAFGNFTSSFVGAVTVTIANNAGGGILTGGGPVTAVNGVATFGGLSINKTGVNYTLRAASAGLTPDTSTAFTINPGPVTHLGFTVPPSNTGATLAITPPVQVSGLDANENLVTSFNGTVTVAIGNNPPPGTGVLSGTLVAGASGGTAVFANLHIDKPNTGYTLTATSGAFSGTSPGFNITTVGGTHLVFTAQPTTTQAGATISAPGGVQITAQDDVGSTVTTFTGNVTLAITSGTGTPGAVLGGTVTVPAVSGVANFTNLNIARSGTGYTLTATATGATSGTSNAFNINPGPATTLLYTGQPSTTAAGAAITPPVVVTAQDAFGNTATGFNSLVTATLVANPGGGTLTGNTTTASSGIATFSNLRINKPGIGYTMRASSGALVQDTSGTFNITSTATQLAFTVQPASPTAAGVAIAPAVQVTAQDSLGNTATGFNSNITVALFDNPNGGTLSGTKIVAAANGIASFSTLNVNKADVGYSLIATSGSLSPAFSNSFDIVPGAPTQLVFTVQPSNTPAGGTIAPPVQVTVRDNQGNTVTGFVGSVTMAFGSNPSGGTLSGTLTQAVSSGVATFSDLSINLAGAYTLQATSPGVAGGAGFTSASFSITGGIATQLVFTTQPANSTAGVPIGPAVRVTARDALNNTATFSGNVTISIANNPSGGALINSTTTVAAVGGIATFANLRLNKTGTPYTLQAVSGALSTTSTGFTVSPGGVSTTLSTVGAAPGGLTASTGASAATITVTARDTLGNAIPSANVVFSATGLGNTLTPSATTDPSGVATGTLSSTASGTKTVSVTVNGVAITQTAPVVVSPAGVSATTSTMSRLPTTIAASTGSATSTMTVTARDQFSNVIPNATVVFGATGSGNTLTPNPPAGALTNLSGVATGTLSSTVAELKVGSATVDGVLITPTVNITVTPATPTVLLFTLQPTNTAAGSTIRPGTGVQVEVRDQFNNRVTTANNSVLLAILNNAGPGGVLSGTNPVTAASGIATFSNLSIDKTGSGYTLLASTAGLASDTSSGFNITSGTVSASLSTVAAAPTTITACSAGCTTGASTASLITVTARDGLGNPIAGASVSLAATGSNNTFTPAGPYTTDGSGVATATLNSTTAQGKTVSATINSVGITQTQAVTVNPAAVSASHSLVGVSTGTITASNGSSATTITATARDAFDNPIQGATVVLAALPTTGNTLTQPGSTTNASGVTTGTLSSTKAEGKTVSATINGVPITQTQPVTVNPAAVSASHSLVAVSTGTITASNGSSATTITATARDVFDNPIQGATVVLAVSPTTGNSLTQPGSTTNASGVATGTLSSTKAEGKTVSATINGVVITQTQGVTVNPAAADHLAFFVQPSTTAATGTIAPPVEVEIRDAFENRVTSATDDITLDIGTNAGGGTLSGTLTVSAIAGVATFSDLSIDAAGSGYTLVAAAAGLTGATSDPFDIN
jgi:hypothetical protein